MSESSVTKPLTARVGEVVGDMRVLPPIDYCARCGAPASECKGHYAETAPRAAARAPVPPSLFKGGR